ncbi:MAG: hypothetical protein OXC69_03115 [Candidatus Tectomicrobia bacterium]|nr:hypothetical protein [Candidatus Tectomicrobia bacterium]
MSGWTEGVSLEDLPERVGVRRGEVVEVCVAGASRPVALQDFSKWFNNRARGIVGIEIELQGESERLAPTRMIASNLSFDRALQKFLERCGASGQDFEAAGQIRSFSARQFLLPVSGASVELFRGSTLVTPHQSGGWDHCTALVDGIGRWMLRNLTADGALPYKYWPSRGADSPADNAIRRFLASLALARLGEFSGSGEIREAARRNLRFNLKRYFRKLGEGRGAIVERTGAKLGAAALAALAILENPARGEFTTELEMLAAGVDHLADAKGRFRTFFFPPERDGDNWNFYSGEALLFWAEALRRGAPCAPSLERCAAAFSQCRKRHRRRRNPAFVPWHTQACVSLYAQTGRREFADFAFEMNDWLLPMQQWEGLDADLRGRFYDPKHREYGPPHAASTGAYCEGLADALALAHAVGDTTRIAAYECALKRGFRSLLQLQFRNDSDAFYIARKDRVMGALRTEVYDNSVRIDSAAHALAAALKVLHPVVLGARVSK